jgi:hypothetical protein
MSPIKRSAEKALEQESAKVFRVLSLGFWLLVGAAFAYYAGVYPLPVGWKISSSSTIQHQKGK